MNCIFEGVATALYTPFTKNGIDFEQFEKLIDRQLKAKVDALVFLGTTGECATVTQNERVEIIKFAVSKLKGKIPIIIGAGSNSTKTACKLSIQAKNLGADAVLSVTPYYNKCEQDGIIRHYQEICKNVKLPVICYNVPKRTGVNIEPKTAKKHCSVDYVCGFKEANSDLLHVKNLFFEIGEKANIYAGNDDLVKEFLSLGAKGVISVASNVIPLKIKDYIRDFKNNYKATSFDFDLFFKLLCCRVNPIPIKYVASVLFNENCNFRLPLTYPDKKTRDFINTQLNILKLKEIGD